MAGGRVRLGEEGKEIGVTRVGDESLGAIDEVGAVPLLGARFDADDVGASRRLGDAVGDELAAVLQALAQPIGFLRFRAGEDDRQRAQLVGGEAGADAGAGVGQLLSDDDFVQRAGAEAAVGLRDAHIGEADLARFFEEFHREARIAVTFLDERHDLLLREIARQFLQHLLLFGEGEIGAGRRAVGGHRWCFSLRVARAQYSKAPMIRVLGTGTRVNMDGNRHATSEQNHALLPHPGSFSLR